MGSEEPGDDGRSRDECMPSQLCLGPYSPSAITGGARVTLNREKQAAARQSGYDWPAIRRWALALGSTLVLCALITSLVRVLL